jgi:hypothetical protein
VEVDMMGLDAVEVAPHIFLVETTKALNVAGRIVN